MTNAEYREVYIEPKMLQITLERKHTFLTELFKSLKNEEGDAFKVIYGEEHSEDYVYPYRRIEFSNIHEFERIVKNSRIVFDLEENYQLVLERIEKIKRKESDNFEYQFNFDLDPRDPRNHDRDFIVKFEFSYKEPKIPKLF
jgi:hypothetical protein